jgi:hypothetical protein
MARETVAVETPAISATLRKPTPRDARDAPFLSLANARALLRVL